MHSSYRTHIYLDTRSSINYLALNYTYILNRALAVSF